MRGYSATQFGFTGVNNAAKAITPSGFDSSYIRRPVTYLKDGANGGSIPFQFVQSYTAYTALNIPFYFAYRNTALPGSLDSLQFGSPQIENWVRYLYTSGGDSSAFGNSPIRINQYFITSVTLASTSAFGSASARLLLQQVSNASAGSSFLTSTDASVWLWVRYIIGASLYPSKTDSYGSPAVDYRTKYVILSGYAATQYGLPRLTGYIQYALNATLQSPQVFGALLIAHKYRYIYQYDGPYAWAVPSPRVSRNIVIYPAPVTTLDADAYGSATFTYGNVLSPPGLDSQLISIDAWASFSPRRVYPNNLDNLEVARPTLDLWTKYVYQVTDFEWYLNPVNRGFGADPFIWNYFDIQTNGWLSARFSNGITVLNGARVASAQGFDSFYWNPGNFIAHRVRYIYGDTYFDSLTLRFFSTYPGVYNAAASFTPTGFDSQSISKLLEIFNGTRTYRQWGADSSEYGSAWVSFLVRDVTQLYSKNSLEFGTSENIVFDFLNRGLGFTIEKPGLYAFQSGNTEVRIYRGMVKPFGDTTMYVSPGAGVKNVTPQLYARGLDFATTFQDPVTGEVFRPSVTHWVRTLTIVEGLNALSFEQGRGLSIRDRTTYVTPAPRVYTVISDKLSVRNALADVYVLQLVFPEGIQWELDEGVHTVYGSPMLEGLDATQWGQAWVRAQGCITKSYFASSLFTWGNAWVHGAVTQYIYHGWVWVYSKIVDDYVISDNDPTPWGKPFTSPYTIYCQEQIAPPELVRQLQRCIEPYHDFKEVAPIPPPGGWGHWVGGHPWFGLTRVATYYSTQYVRQWHSTSSFGSYTYGSSMVFSSTATVASSIQYVTVEGIKSLKYGMPRFPVRTRTTYALGSDSLEFGVVDAFAVPLQPEPYIYPPAISSSTFGVTKVELYNRYLLASGFNALKYFVNPPSPPMLPMVHHPYTFPAVGLDATLFSEYATIGYRIRYLNLTDLGFEATQMDGEYEFLGSQMTVRHLTNPLFTQGADQTLYGTSTVWLKYRYINPYMIQGSRCLGRPTIN